MEVKKEVKSKTAKKSHIGVLKKKPGKTSLAGASQTKGTKSKAKAGTVRSATGKTTRQEDKELVKETKSTRTGNEAGATKAENELETTETSKTTDRKAAKNAQKTKTVKKIKQNTVNSDTTAGTSKMKVKKKETNAVKNIQKNEASNRNAKIMEEVYEAITVNGEPRKGASSQAIKKYIFNKRGIENEDATHKRINNHINKVLRQAVENGELARPGTSKGSAPMASATGRFMLVKKVNKSNVSKKKKVDEDG